MSTDALLAVAQRFHADHVQYLLVGGLAVAAHGYLRFTADIDLIIGFDGSNEHKAITALSALGFVPRVPVDMKAFLDPDQRAAWAATQRAAWAATKEMLVFTVTRQTTEIDLFLHAPADFAQKFAAAMWKAADEAGRIPIPFMDLDSMLAMKRAAGRPKDLYDAQQLEAIRAGRKSP